MKYENKIVKKSKTTTKWITCLDNVRISRVLQLLEMFPDGLLQRDIFSLLDAPRDKGIMQALRVLYKRATGKEIPKTILVDIKNRFACSEHPATAANPTQKEIKDHDFKPVNPAMEFLPGTNRELITPTMMDAAIGAGILEFVTEQSWKKY